MDKIHIDVETYSSVDIKSSGVYKYTQSLDFEILMVAYAIDDEPIKIIDLAQGELLNPEFMGALLDPKVKKHAHNANFERQAFKAIGFDIPINQWYCSMIKAAYCGLPLGLDQVSKALKFGEDKAKMTEGKALIRFFSVPCKPTKANDKRNRNLPRHDLEKWIAYKKYCMQDVEAEREISKRLASEIIPDFERQMYILDQEINDRGIKIDIDMAENAIALDSIFSKELASEMIKLTAIDNPNSAAQLKKWLSEAMKKEIKTLAKEEIPKLIEEAGPGAVSDVLALRQRIAKSSIKKYSAMQNCMTDDGRAHGLFQFYGANRTGRWAGRLIQLQNLPRNYLRDLDLARNLVVDGSYDNMTLMFDNISDVLSQLIRTAFVAKKGHTFAVADFSAIEARVLSWIASEKWRLDVFNSHGKIYEASASMMFNVPIEKVTKGSDLRQKGKVAELALGYGGSVGALMKMGGEGMGLSDLEMKEIVNKWRKANPKIVKFWKDVERASISAIKHKKIVKYNNLIFESTGKVFTIQLPSGRKLYYCSPHLALSKFDTECVGYWGMSQTTKQWSKVDTYGGKITENIVQAVARDLLAESMQNINAENYPIVMHVHDEVVSEVPIESADKDLAKLCDIMSINSTWSKGLPLGADGYVTKYYKKD